MLRMDQVCVVRHKVLVEKLGQREVAHQLGISRNTKKAAQFHELKAK